MKRRSQKIMPQPLTLPTQNRRFFVGLQLLRKSLLLAIVAGLIGGCSEPAPERKASFPDLSYPQAKRVDQVDDYHGTEVSDPYRWLEDENSPATKDWIAAQRVLTRGVLDSSPQREAIRENLISLWNYAKYSNVRKRGERYFYSVNNGLQNQSVFYVSDYLSQPGEVLIDPNEFSEDGTVALATTSISHNGRYVAYAISEAGSDWREWRIIDVDTGEVLPDTLKWSKFANVTWTFDNRGFFYIRYQQPDDESLLSGINEGQRIYYHRVGTSQESDQLIYENNTNPNLSYNTAIGDSGRYLVISASEGSDVRNQVLYIDLTQPDFAVNTLFDKVEATYKFVGNDDQRFYFFTNYRAPLGRLVAVNIERPQKGYWKPLVTEKAETLRSVTMVGDYFALNYLKDAISLIRIHDLNGDLEREIELPGPGKASGLSGNRGDDIAFYLFSSYLQPETLYSYQLNEGQSARLKAPELSYSPDEFVSEQIFYKSKDGTRVPMVLSYRKGLARDGTNPTLLYGYGGFNIAITPRFSPTVIAWMQSGGVYAVANLRGGSEYGEKWHEAGMLENKQNVFDDFIAAAKWLVDNDYTDSSQLAITGRSNGGLLVGAAMVQEPDLFAAAIPAVGVMDMLRFQNFTIGWAWTSDYGSSDNPDQFAYLYQYSPYHNLTEGQVYPTTMVVTADHDDRVVPAHSYKFAAQLQHAHGGNNPVLINIEERAGHGAGKPVAKQIQSATDFLVFLEMALDMPAVDDAVPTEAVAN